MVLVVLVLSMAPRGGPVEPAREGPACLFIVQSCDCGTGRVLGGVLWHWFCPRAVRAVGGSDESVCWPCGSSSGCPCTIVQGAARPYNTPRSQPQTGSGEGIGIVQSVCELSLSFKGKGRAASVRDGSSLNPRANATSGG